MNRRRFLQTTAAAPFLTAAAAQTSPDSRIDLRGATVVVRPGELPNAEKTAATVLVEEIAKRTGITLQDFDAVARDRSGHRNYLRGRSARVGPARSFPLGIEAGRVPAFRRAAG